MPLGIWSEMGFAVRLRSGRGRLKKYSDAAPLTCFNLSIYS